MPPLRRAVLGIVGDRECIACGWGPYGLTPEVAAQLRAERELLTEAKRAGYRHQPLFAQAALGGKQ